MVFLNNLSIKSKMLFIVFVPLSLLIMLSLWEIDTLKKDISELSSIEANLTVGNQVMAHLFIADKLRLTALQQKTGLFTPQLETQIQQNSEQILSQSNALLSAHNKNSKLAIQEGFIASLQEMNEAFADVGDFDHRDIDDWSAWVIEDIAFELFNALEKLDVDTRIEQVNQKVNVVNQLRWIIFYELQENWLIHVMLQRQSFDWLSDLRTNAAKENVFVGRFLTQNANDKQIELLLNTFQHNDFEKSLFYKEQLLTRDRDFFNLQQKDQVEVVLDNRLSLMMDMSKGIITSTIEEITLNIQSVKRNIYWLIGAIVALILLIFILAMNLINRIFAYLKGTIIKLERIESENDYSILISEEGRDEFTQFSSKLNKLIAERKVSVGKMIQAKEDAEKANKAKSYFLANMSHEIRTPLNGILGMYQILAATDLSHSQQNHLETINQSSKTLLMLINDILDISKIESGKLTISPVSIKFREALYETVSMVSSKAVEKQLRLSVDIDPQLPVELMLDEHRIRQIVMNLLSNAIKFTAKGEVALSVTGKIIDQECVLTVSVQDTGIGIAKESQEAIFQPFVQEDGSITREFGGTGLGLAISAQLVKIMGGSIKCDSEKGKGSRFYFDIHLGLSDNDAPAPTQSHQVMLIDSDGHKAALLEKELTFLGLNVLKRINAASDVAVNVADDIILLYCQNDLPATQQALKHLVDKFPNNALLVAQETDDEPFDFRDQIGGQLMIPLLGQRCLKVLNSAFSERFSHEQIKVEVEQVSSNALLPILLVEDNLVNQKVASFFLKSLGYESKIAENGLIAVNAIKEGGNFSTILMDCMMPIMDGFTATQEIRKFEQESGTHKTPIIALTASIFDEDIKQCYAAGMDDYLAKPIDKIMFEEKLKEYAPC